jgi:hypothetical protein
MAILPKKHEIDFIVFLPEHLIKGFTLVKDYKDETLSEIGPSIPSSKGKNQGLPVKKKEFASGCGFRQGNEIHFHTDTHS